MKTSTISTPTAISTTDLMSYDGEYKTDYDKFRDMSGLAQGAIIATGMIAAGAACYAIYKGINYIKDNRLPMNQYYNPYMPYQQPQYQYYQNPVPQSAVNIQGQYNTNDNNQPTLSFQANSIPVMNQQPQQPVQPQPVAPIVSAQYPNHPQQMFQRIVTPNGQIQDVPVAPQSPVTQMV